ncbi:MAG: putative toxin-antitoxin system toxin component, PIN family [Nitrospirae bacterium]|nr:putative toxin-antitoxin system toxin component, PIN family [Nitrospirota bacterium]
MRVVIDTNVIVSAVIAGGTPLMVLLLAVRGEVALITSPFLLDELRRVLCAKFSAETTRTDAFIARLKERAHIVHPKDTVSILDDDPDNRVLECTLAGGASIIVTGDHDLLRLNEFREIQILKPAEFLEFLSRGK